MTPDDLFLQVLVTPDDEALRAVWVDWLLERGDLRGEHARLRRLGREAEAQALQLEHAKAWVPAQLDRFAVRSSLQFRDGLLEGCSLLPMGAAEARELSREPLWAAVRQLDRAPIELVEQATSLERLTSVDLQLLHAVWGRPGLLPKVRELGVRVAYAPGLIDALLQVDLPSLTTLSLCVLDQGMNPHQRQGMPECCEDCARPGPFEPAEALQPGALRRLFEAPMGQRLQVLELHTGYVDLTSFIGEL